MVLRIHIEGKMVKENQWITCITSLCKIIEDGVKESIKRHTLVRATKVGICGEHDRLYPEWIRHIPTSGIEGKKTKKRIRYASLCKLTCLKRELHEIIQTIGNVTYMLPIVWIISCLWPRLDLFVGLPPPNFRNCS